MTDKAQMWAAKLFGNNIVDSWWSGGTSYSKSKVPRGSRVLPPGFMITMDFNPDRLNVHVDDKGIYTYVKMGWSP